MQIKTLNKKDTEYLVNRFKPLIPLLDNSNNKSIQWSNKDLWAYAFKDMRELWGSLEYENGNKMNIGNRMTGLALITGTEEEGRSGISVIDCDIGHKEGVNGIENLIRTLKDYGIPKEEIQDFLTTYGVETPNGGKHFYIKHFEGLKNTSDIIEGVDIRANGGYITLPYTKREINGEIKEYKEIDKHREIKEVSDNIKRFFIELCYPKGTPKTSRIEDSEGVIKTKVNDNIIIPKGCRDDYIFKEMAKIKDNDPNVLFAYGCYLLRFTEQIEGDEITENMIKEKAERICANRSKLRPNGKTLIPIVLEEEERTNGKILIKDQLPYQYNKELGIYEKIEDSKIKKLWKDNFTIEELNKANSLSNFKNSFINLADEVSKEQQNNRYLALNNEYIDMETMESVNKSDNHFILLNIPNNRIKDNEEYEEKFNNSKWKNTFLIHFDEDTQKTIGQVMALCLYPHMKEFHRAILLTGATDNGKSILLDIIKYWYGGIDENGNEGRNVNLIGGLSFGKFSDKFAPSTLRGKAINIVSDDVFNSELITMGIFKMFITSESFLVEPKGIDPFNMKFNIMSLHSLNELPYIADMNESITKRILNIPFNTSFGTEEQVKRGERDYIKDPHLTEYLIKYEMDIIITWTLKHLETVLDNIKKGKDPVDISKYCQLGIENLRDSCDPLGSFIKECCYIGKIPSDKRTSCNEFYDEFKEYCECLGYAKVMTQRSMTQKLKERYSRVKQTNPLWKNGQKIRFFEGICLNRDYNPNESELTEVLINDDEIPF